MGLKARRSSKPADTSEVEAMLKAARAALGKTVRGKIPPARKVRSKSEIIRLIAAATGLTVRQVTDVFDTLLRLIEADLGPDGPGVALIPEVARLKAKETPARRSRSFRNPRTGELLTGRERPPSRRLEVQPVRRLGSVLDGGLEPDEEAVRAAPAAAAGAEAAEPELQDVLLGASAPARARPGQEFTVRFVAYVEALEDRVRDTLTKLSKRSTTHLGLQSCRWAKDTPVTVKLHASHLEVEEPTLAFDWNGRFNLLDFDARLSDDAPEDTIVLKLDVRIEGTRVARLRMDLEVNPKTRSRQRTDVSGVEAAKTAFASYASQDRDEVLGRVASLEISAGLRIFVDCLSLRPGDQWKPELEREIVDRDLFLLYWSKHAAASEWVAWEWNMALDRKGEDLFEVHPLTTVQEAPPPERLAHLHFSDPKMLVREGLRRARDP